MKIDDLDNFYAWQVKWYDIIRGLYLYNRRDAIDLIDNKKVVDIACGTGMNFPNLLEKGIDIVGLDYSEAMLVEAKKRYPECEFFRCDVSKKSLESFDSDGICTYSLSMVENWRDCLDRMMELVKNGNRVVILDFYDLDKIVYVPFKWWLKQHGVRPVKLMEKYISEICPGYTKKIFNFGYNAIFILE